MTDATVLQSYATILQADTYLEIHTDWLDLWDEVKEDALLSARYFIDSNFSCSIDVDAIPEEVSYANSLLAYDYYIQGDLFFDNSKSTKRTKVVAGKVESEKEYFYGSKEKPSSLGKVKSILKSVCTSNVGRLVRV